MKMLCNGLMLLLGCIPSAVWALPSHVSVKKTNEGWRLWVDSQPYFVKGIAYEPTPVGESGDLGTMRDWMVIDDNHDGRNDIAYETWVDKNRNNRQDPDESAAGDFALFKEMGVNTIRLYHHASSNREIQKVNSPEGGFTYNHAPNKELLRDLFKTYGVRVAMGDLLGAYTSGSGAAWDLGTDYRDPGQQQHMVASVEDMVAEFKDEPFLLCYILGNENNYGRLTHTNAGSETAAYADFVEKVVRRIHQLDPHHPVVLCNGEVSGLPLYAKRCPSVDIFGVNSYRRPGFGTLWKEISSAFDRPVLLTEYGVLKQHIVRGELDEDWQAKEHQAAWCDIVHHAAGQEPPGAAIGGFAYEWTDEWYNDGNPFKHDLSPNGIHNEWHGLAGSGDGSQPLERQLRKAYFTYQSLWTGQAACPPAPAPERGQPAVSPVE